MLKELTLTRADIQPMLQYIDAQWTQLKTKSDKGQTTLIGLPYPYIKPSISEGYFRFNEQYYWDSYFTALGLDDEKLASGMLDNLAYMFKNFGLIPNANRHYFTGRSQPPVFTSFIFHIYEKYSKSKSWLLKYMKIAMDEYEQVWSSSEHPHARNVYNGLSRYYDVNNLHDLAEAESGWDMTPRFDRRCLDFIPIDLNCLLYKYETDIAKAFAITEDKSQHKIWIQKSQKRRQAINNLMWNEKKGLYFDFDYYNNKLSGFRSLAAYYSLWSGVADNSQAARLVENLPKFLHKGGLAATARDFTLRKIYGSQKTQWEYPNGWAPLHIIVCQGLENYGFHNEAKQIAFRWLITCNDWHEAHGEMLEKYNVVHTELQPASGVYPTQKGFGWTNASVAYFANIYL